MIKRVLVTGGAGYVGSALVPRLLAEGHRVRVLDLFLYGEDALAPVKDHDRLETIRGDLRDGGLVEQSVRDCDAVIHLACVSNDPSFELDPKLGKSINYDAFEPLVRASRRAGVARFVYASSSSVYGVKEEPQVTEDLPLQPLTDYSKYKAMCEQVLAGYRRPGFATLTIRPATVCGYAPRLRLDLTVNILTNHAVSKGHISVHGGGQKRPNIHIDDMVELYVQSLRWPTEKIDGGIYNVGRDNRTIREVATAVRAIVGDAVTIETVPTNDARSYHISADKIRRELGFEATRPIEQAIRDLVEAFGAGKIPNAFDNDRYYNVRTMQKWMANNDAA